MHVQNSGQMLREREALEDSKDTDHCMDTPGGWFIGQVILWLLITGTVILNSVFAVFDIAICDGF